MREASDAGERIESLFVQVVQKANGNAVSTASLNNEPCPDGDLQGCGTEQVRESEKVAVDRLVRQRIQAPRQGA
ncbi:hypothetical protein GCM10017667_21850 [Streptomyces filamentosus]|uniref:Uncharacterized protein n=1 Tax=Streptomyces filamentosus TaxID=67294 RepID=A0A919BIZ2_STRFL|nr:hypothetical protein GCM10017667_21850 [Streptomyces filamentosus]